jgi:hypothetical protein
MKKVRVVATVCITSFDKRTEWPDIVANRIFAMIAFA